MSLTHRSPVSRLKLRRQINQSIELPLRQELVSMRCLSPFTPLGSAKRSSLAVYSRHTVVMPSFVREKFRAGSLRIVPLSQDFENPASRERPVPNFSEFPQRVGLARRVQSLSRCWIERIWGFVLCQRETLIKTVGCDTNCGRKTSIKIMDSIVNRQCDGEENELTAVTRREHSMHRVTSKGNSVDICSRALEIKLPQSTKR